MRNHEFVELHGKEAWEYLVAPLQPSDTPSDRDPTNANGAAHFKIILPVLKLLGFKTSNLLEAQAELERLRAEAKEKPCEGK